MAAGLVAIIAALLLLIVPLALMIVALVDLSGRPSSQWEVAGQSKLVWVLLVIFVGLVGPILYLALAKPKLVEAATTLAERPEALGNQ